jgi:hypothetical protein
LQFSYSAPFPPLFSAGIFEQSKGARNRGRNRVVVPARQATQPGRNGSLESILGLLKSLKIRAQLAYRLAVPATQR